MKFKDYQLRSYTAIQPHDDAKDEVLNWVVGLGEEVGEVMNHVKHLFWGNEEVDKMEMAKELGDILWYMSALATVWELNLDAVAELNVAKLEHRFGGRFSEAKSKARHSAEEKFSETDLYDEIVGRLDL